MTQPTQPQHNATDARDDNLMTLNETARYLGQPGQGGLPLDHVRAASGGLVRPAAVRRPHPRTGPRTLDVRTAPARSLRESGSHLQMLPPHPGPRWDQ
jgi:hypothetical protein